MNTKQTTEMEPRRKVGRKPAEFPKVPLFVYLRHDLVRLAGGKAAVKVMLETVFEQMAKKL